MVWRSLLPYRVEFEVTATKIERFSLMEGQATGDLEGIGRWRLYEQDGVTAVLYEWNVATTKPWMNRMAPLLRPVFEWNHDWVMRRGGEGIAARLGCGCWRSTSRACGDSARRVQIFTDPAPDVAIFRLVGTLG